jgi:hypothetical protein
MGPVQVTWEMQSYGIPGKGDYSWIVSPEYA